MPGVPRAMMSAFTSGAIGVCACTSRICSRPISGRPPPAGRNGPTHQRRVEHIGPVGRGNNDDARVAFESVHFHQQLIQRRQARRCRRRGRAARATDGADFVDEHARRILRGLLNAASRRADADEHLDEVGA
jgi:hypothetical protein